MAIPKRSSYQAEVLPQPRGDPILSNVGLSNQILELLLSNPAVQLQRSVSLLMYLHPNESLQSSA